MTAFDDLLAERGPPGVPLRGVGTGIPGPVDPATSRVVTPSRMPGWNDFPVADHLATRYDLPILVENDANLMAVGEARAWPGSANLMVLKAGSGIGCGVIVDGRLHRGRGAAGDISHVRVTVRRGRHLLLRPHRLPGGLRQRRRPDGRARRAGHRRRRPGRHRRPGQRRRARGHRPGARRRPPASARCSPALVNFFNPDAIVIGGSLSAAEPLDHLDPRRGLRALPAAGDPRPGDRPRHGPGRDAALLGAGALLLDAALAP